MKIDCTFLNSDQKLTISSRWEIPFRTGSESLSYINKCAQVLLQASSNSRCTDIVMVKSHLTLTAGIRDLSKRVVACVALAANNARSALALARLCVARPREGTHRVAVTWETGVGAPWVVVKLLQTRAQKSHQALLQQ